MKRDVAKIRLAEELGLAVNMESLENAAQEARDKDGYLGVTEADWAWEENTDLCDKLLTLYFVGQYGDKITGIV